MKNPVKKILCTVMALLVVGTSGVVSGVSGVVLS